jgi:hypothetical protein
MRVPKRSRSIFSACAALIAPLALAVGCMTPSPPVVVSYDEREDLSRFRTWDWIEGDAVYVRAPFGDEAEVEADLSARVQSALRERGLAYAPGAGELRVAALLVGTRSYQAISRARAVQTLNSYHDMGTIEVQMDQVERLPIDRCRFAIYVTAARQERMLFQAVSEERYTDGCAAHVDDAVHRLVERFPEPSGARDSDS